MTDRLTLAAPAKLNLSLTVVGRRPDGFHLLESTLVLLEHADQLVLTAGRGEVEVTLDPAAGIRDGELPADGQRNLAWRGLQAARPDDVEGFRLELRKAIPVAAGLGGGSSDAAAAWRLGRAWSGDQAPPDESGLRDLARLGADVPFFAAAVPAARVTGIGEIVGPLSPPAAQNEVVVTLPPVRLTTTAVFAALRARDWSAPDGRVERGTAALDLGRNDLLAAARRLAPELDGVFAVVRRIGGDPHLSGSGPAVFALTDDPERAEALAAGLREHDLLVIRTRLAARAASIASVLDDGRPGP